MNQIFIDELNKQLKISKISKRKLSLLIGKQETYIHQVLNNKIKTIDYIKVEEMFSCLNLIDTNLLDYYLFLLGVELPDKILNNIKKSNMIKNNYTVYQCYKDYYETQNVNEYLTGGNSENYDNHVNEMLNDINNHPQNIKNELQNGLDDIYRILKIFIDKSIDVEDYTNKHRAETVIKTLIQLSTKPENFSFFESLLNIPLHRIDPNDRQKIISHIENTCKYEYHFIDDINDSTYINVDNIIENHPHYIERFKPSEAQKLWDNLSNDK